MLEELDWGYLLPKVYAKSMIKNNGGKIWAESDREVIGSRFIVEVPVDQPETQLEKTWGRTVFWVGLDLMIWQIVWSYFVTNHPTSKSIIQVVGLGGYHDYSGGKRLKYIGKEVSVWRFVNCLLTDKRSGARKMLEWNLVFPVSNR